MFNDLRYAVRMLLKNPGFTTVGVLTLALGIGANTSFFSVVQAVLVRPLPFVDPDRLVMIWETQPEIPRLQATIPDFVDWRQSSHNFEQMAAYSFQATNKAILTGHGEPLQVQATAVSHNLLSLLGVSPSIGRGFLASEESAHERVVLLSDGLWRRKFGADPSLVGQAINLDGEAFVVLGILPADRAFPAWADVWTPLSLMEPMLQSTRQYHPLEVIGRLKPGVTVQQAQIEMQMIARRLAGAYPATNRSVGALVAPLAGQVVGEVRPALLVVWAAVGLILLIATANVAHLVLARGLSRKREAAVRAALGASPSRLICHFLTENLLLAFLGGFIGLLIAFIGTPALQRLAAGQIPRFERVTFNSTVFVFTMATSAFTGLLFGLLPALRGSRVDLLQVLKLGSSTASQQTARTGFLLVTAEVALGLVVLVGAGLLVRSFVALLGVDPGFRTENVLTMQVPLPSTKYNWEQAARFFQDELFPRIRSLPGVEGVAAVNSVTMSLERTERSRYATRFGVPGQIYEEGRFPVAQIRWVSPDYFRVLKIPLRRGRLFTDADLGKPLYVINETLAQHFFPNHDPILKNLLTDVVTSSPRLVQVVGVVGDVRDRGLEVEAQPTLYVASISPGMTLIIHTRVEPLSLSTAVRQAVQAADKDQPVHDVRTMQQIVADSMARRRFALVLLAGFAVLALLLTTVGVYGVVSYSVSRRTYEIGIRMALGAAGQDVFKLVIGQALAPTMIGVVVGLIGAFALTRLMSSLLFDVTATDPVTLVGVSLLLTGAALLACYIPARRATKVDPMVALRYE
jgi:predicted permease